jgi:hypothetical protein
MNKHDNDYHIASIHRAGMYITQVQFQQIVKQTLHMHNKSHDGLSVIPIIQCFQHHIP